MMPHPRARVAVDTASSGGRATLGTVDKSELRRRVRSNRSDRGAAEPPEALLAQFHLLRQELGIPLAPGMTLAGYLPAPTEPDCTALLRAADEAGAKVIVPRTLPDCRMEWVAWTPNARLQPDRHGLQAPGGEPLADALTACTIVLVPALAVDRSGTRLGQGAGYYDRALSPLARWPEGPLRVAVVHPEEVMAAPLPGLPHDAPMDAALTAAGWARL